MCGHDHHHHHHGKTLLVTSDGIGTEPELRTILMRSFLATLANAGEGVEIILLVNRGVLLATEGSDVLEDLQKLDKAGVAIFACGTCLDYFDARKKLKIGSIGNMAATVAAITDHAQVVTIG